MLGAAVQKLVTGFVDRALHCLIVAGGGAEVSAVSLDKLLVACCADTHTLLLLHNKLQSHLIDFT
jgi:hypothetical protein